MQGLLSSAGHVYLGSLPVSPSSLAINKRVRDLKNTVVEMKAQLTSTKPQLNICKDQELLCSRALYGLSLRLNRRNRAVSARQVARNYPRLSTPCSIGTLLQQSLVPSSKTSKAWSAQLVRTPLSGGVDASPPKVGSFKSSSRRGMFSFCQMIGRCLARKRTLLASWRSQASSTLSRTLIREKATRGSLHVMGLGTSQQPLFALEIHVDHV
ncbi:hypothetical protein C8Q79DRAFT_138687 [Trametes meyenii]|nr:hypothetical protein C8Q79DRAFT_138687 [Trametes meyenii]